MCSNMALGSFLVLGLTLVLQLQAAAGKRAAYFMDNSPAGNNLVSLEIDSKTGLLSAPVLTPTGGKGALAIAGNSYAGPDSLFSQDAIFVDGNYLFVVNPGSNTLSLFYISEDDPTHPTLVGEPADTLGEFPTAVAYSSKLEIACVLNAGAKAGATCISVTKEGLVPLDTSPRSIAAHYNQTTPPSGHLGTVSDILFNPSSTAVFAVIKGTTNGKLGAIYVWPVIEGNVSTHPVISTSAGVIDDFGSAFVGGDDRLYVSEGIFGGVLFDVSSSFVLTVAAITVIPNPGAPCWVNYSPKFESLYVMPGLLNNITVVDPNSGVISGYINFPAPAPGGDPGAFDAAIDRDWLYVLPGDASVLVFKLDIDVKKIKLVQRIDLSSLGDRKSWEGMAIFHSSLLDTNKEVHSNLELALDI